MPLIALYLGGIVAANLIAARVGPVATVATAGVLIGLDITARDRLHDRWSRDDLAFRMASLIFAGGLLSAALNYRAAPIALASAVSFSLATLFDSVVYHIFRYHPPRRRVMASNTASSVLDSLIFPTLAFGRLMPLIVLGHIIAKIGGGYLWSLLLFPPRTYKEVPPG